MSSAEGACLILVQGTKIPRAMGAWPKNERNKRAFWEHSCAHSCSYFLCLLSGDGTVESWAVVTNWQPPQPEVFTVWSFPKKYLLTSDLWPSRLFPPCLCVNICVCVVFKQCSRSVCFCNLPFDSILYWPVTSVEFLFCFYSIELKSENHCFLVCVCIM